MNLRVRVASGIVCVALLAGCGGSGKSASPSTTTTVPPTTTVVPSTPRQLAADRATARRAVLTLADLPHGFLGTPHDNSSNTPIPPPVEQQFVTCAHVPKALAAHLLDDKPDPTAPSVDSDDFSLPGADDKTVTQVQNNVEIHRTAHELVAAFGVLANPATTACWRALFLAAAKEASPPGGTAALTAVTLTRRPGIGDIRRERTLRRRATQDKAGRKPCDWSRWRLSL